MLASGPALAHHVMGGTLPASFAQGLLSGLGHPIIGIDHLAAIIACGLIAAALGGSRALPLAFVGASLVGVGLHLALVDLPGAELLIAGSVIALGLLLASRRLPHAGLLAALFGLAGMAHGYAYGESIVGAEPQPLLAYLLGLALVQGAIAMASHAVAGAVAGSGESRRLGAYRAGGCVVLLVGAAAFGLALA